MRTKRILSIVLTLAMLLGMFPGMSLTASAADSMTEITPSNTSGTMTITLTIKAAQTITASDVTATYGDTDKSVSASVTTPATGGGAISYTVKDGSGDYIDVASDGKLTIKKVPASGKAYVIVKAAATDDYAETTKEVTVTINKAEATVTAKNQSIYVGGTVPTLSGADFYTVSGLVGEDALTTNPTLAYQKNGSAATPDNTTAGTYDIVASGASAGDNYNISYTNGTLTISDKGTQTISAENVTVTYGETGKSVSATVTDPATGGGDISYAVKTGSADYIDVDASTGALTIKKVPADGKAYVTVTASETNMGGTGGKGYAAATKDVTVNISKATVTIAAKDQSIYVGGTVPTLSGVDFYTVTGLVGEETLTTAPTLAYQKNGAAATPDNTTAGTYDIVPSGAAASANYSISYTKGTLTISTQSSYSGGGSVSPSTSPTQSGESYTVPIENESSVSVGANISNGTATVNEITDEQIEQATQPTSASGSDSEKSNTLTIDLSGAKQQVTAVEIPEKTVEKLADAAADSGNNIENVAVELSSGGIEFDASAMATISKESTGSVKVEIAEKPASELNASQQASLEGKQTEMVFGVNVSSGNKEIHQFNGNAKVHKNHTATKDKNFYHIEYLPDNGKAQRLISEHTGTQGIYKERHASDYAIVYDENDQNENIKPLSGVTFADTTYTGKPQSIKITGVSADSVDDVKVPADAYEITGVTTQTNAGTYQFTLTAKEGSGFRGSTVGTWKINKGKTSFSVKGATVKAKKLKNKKQAVTVKVSNLSTGSLKPTFAIKKVTKGQKKKVKINKKTGKVTLKKGCKKCKITVVATSKANANREKATATAKIVVK